MQMRQHLGNCKNYQFLEIATLPRLGFKSRLHRWTRHRIRFAQALQLFPIERPLRRRWASSIRTGVQLDVLVQSEFGLP